MDAFFTMLRSVALFVVMALPGYIFIKTKFLKQEHSMALSKMLTHLGLPFLIVSCVLGIDLNLEFLKNTAVLILTSLAFAYWSKSLSMKLNSQTISLLLIEILITL